MLALFGNASVKSPWALWELGVAQALNVPIVLICHSGFTPRDLPSPLSRYQAVQAHDPNGLSRVFGGIASQFKLREHHLSFQQFTRRVQEVEAKQIPELKPSATDWSHERAAGSFEVQISGNWSAADFSFFFDACRRLYLSLIVPAAIQSAIAKRAATLGDPAAPGEVPQLNLTVATRFSDREVMQVLPEYEHTANLTDRDLSQLVTQFGLINATDYLLRLDPIRARRVEFASPGVTDLAGIAQGLAHVKDLVVKCIDVHTSKRERELRNSILEQQLESEVLKNVRAKLEVLQSLGLPESVCIQAIADVLPAVATIQRLVERQQITGATEVERDG